MGVKPPNADDLVKANIDCHKFNIKQVYEEFMQVVYAIVLGLTLQQ